MDLILGTAQLVGRYGVMAAHDSSMERAASVLNAARRLGIRSVDTAPAYQGAEVAIGVGGSGFEVHTKLPPNIPPAVALAASLKRLRRESVEVLHLHDPDAVLEAENRQVAAARQLIGNGAGAIGASVYTRNQYLAAVMDPMISVIQAPMNVLDRAISDEDLHFAARNGTDVIARSALLQGLLGDPKRALGRIRPLDEALTAFSVACMTIERQPVEVAIGWLRSRPSISGIVAGAETPQQLEELVLALDAPLLPKDVIALLANLPQTKAVDPRDWKYANLPVRQRG